MLGQGKVGGMNVYVRELSRNFSAMGLKVDIFTRCHGGQESETPIEEEGVRVIHLPAGPLDAPLDGFFSHLPGFVEEVRRVRQREALDYQVVHSHYWLSGWAGRRLAQEWEVPHVATFHTLAKAKMQARPGEREPFLRSEVERELMASADLIISSSPQEKEAMVRLYGASEEGIQIVPPGVDLSLFRPLDGQEARSRIGLNGEKIILYVGRIEPLKGLELLCQATAIMEIDEPFRVLVIGGDLEGEKEVVRLKSLSQQTETSPALEFVGRMDQRMLPVYYSAADVCVVPSYYESFSLVALEAMACGTPVVACRVGGMPVVVQHGRTGYLHSWRCPEPFATSLEAILSSVGLQRSMSLAARERAESMGWDRAAGRIYELYQSLPPPRGGRPARA